MLCLETKILPPVLPPNVSIWSGQTVDVISGPNVLSLELAGLTVGEVMSVVRDAVNLDSDAHSYVNGQPVEHATVLLPHDRLEFVQAWGRKGGGDFESRLIDELKSINRSLSDLRTTLKSVEHFIAKPQLSDMLNKGEYSVREVSRLTQAHGVKPAKETTVRLACWDGRIPDARQNESNHYLIPRDAVIRILDEGIPPQRR
ncbi:hypothetical protein [Rubinisphaera sp. JC750]|uniref:hypothetical protein n=1 Tax=Rubinisphaera sp. JC750 TaxID=2898658 RepID=UPI001F23E3E9|nr:hypothetical protein [Rubinisphaera sp. JC750]